MVDGAKLSQFADNFLYFFQDNPEVLEEDAENIVIEMLEGKYPC